MSDQVLMDNYLLLLKSTVEVYVHGTLESSNDKIRAILKDSLNATLENQAKTYDEMTKYNWYTIDNVQESAIEGVLNTLNE